MSPPPEEVIWMVAYKPGPVSPWTVKNKWENNIMAKQRTVDRELVHTTLFLCQEWGVTHRRGAGTSLQKINLADCFNQKQTLIKQGGYIMIQIEIVWKMKALNIPIQQCSCCQRDNKLYCPETIDKLVPSKCFQLQLPKLLNHSHIIQNIQRQVSCVLSRKWKLFLQLFK